MSTRITAQFDSIDAADLAARALRHSLNGPLFLQTTPAPQNAGYRQTREDFDNSPESYSGVPGAVDMAGDPRDSKGLIGNEEMLYRRDVSLWATIDDDEADYAEHIMRGRGGHFIHRC